MLGGGVLYGATQLERLRTQLAGELGGSLETSFEIGSLRPAGFGGIGLRGLKWTRHDESGTGIEVDVDRLALYPRWFSLLKGRLEISSVRIEQPTVSIAGISLDGMAEGDLFGDGSWTTILESLEKPFLLDAVGGVIEIERSGGREPLQIDIDSLRIEKQRTDAAVILTMNGQTRGDTESPIDMEGYMPSPDEVSLEITSTGLNLAELITGVSGEDGSAISGEVSPTFTLRYNKDEPLRFTVRTNYSGIRVDGFPDALNDAEGSANIQASYHSGIGALLIDSATAESDKVSGSLRGGIDFAAKPIWFDIGLTADRMPANDLVYAAIGEQLRTYGDVEVTLDPDSRLDLRFLGNPREPAITGSLTAGTGTITYVPNTDTYPPMRLALANIKGAWDTYRNSWEAGFDITDGEMELAAWDVKAQRINGKVHLSPESIRIEPLTVEVFDNPMIARFEYARDTNDFEFAIDGRFAQIEETKFHDHVRNLWVRGSVDLAFQLNRKDDVYALRGDFDANRAQVDFQWWFSKPVGIGGNGTIDVDWGAGKDLQIILDAETASSDLYGKLDFARRKDTGKVALHHAAFRSDRVDLGTAERVLNIPYRIRGGTGTAGYYEVWIDPDNKDWNYHRIGGYVDEVEIEAIAADASPIEITGAVVDVAINSGADPTGEVWLYADTANMPSLGGTWLVPLEPPPQWKSRSRRWQHNLGAGVLSMPPWNGTHFRGRAYTNDESSGLEQFSANIEDGKLNGHIHLNKEENHFASKFQWEDVPVRYFIEHLNYDEVLTGNIDGQVEYALDRDDPNTLEGQGDFVIQDGEFKADFLYSFLVGNSEDSAVTLPPSLDFQSLGGEVKFAGDRVETPNISLKSQRLTLNASGNFIRQGDMEYEISTAIPPEIAETIPTIRDNFNVQGHKISGQPIELAFTVSGPTFNPRGQLAELPPASVAFASGVLEVGRETANIIDFPRKILVDLLRMGGGIVGGGGGSRDDK